MIESMDNDKNKNQGKSETSTTPALDNFSKDLIKLAEQGKLDPVIGRRISNENSSRRMSKKLNG
jgi:ATP-dependent Clp protease ATP-binding subunit ClpC